MNREMDREKEEETYGDEKMEKCKKKKKRTEMHIWFNVTKNEQKKRQRM